MKTLLGFFIFSFSSAMVVALPLPNKNINAMLLPETFTADYDFTGIVGLSNCSGSLVQLEGASDDDFGLVLTNGHCLEGGFLAPGTFVYNKPSTRRLTVFGQTTQKTFPVTAQKIFYSTMTKTDMTLYQISFTYRQVREKSGIEPLTMASSHPGASVPIEIISGFWKKGYRCEVNGFAYNLKEDKWLWEDAIRYSSTGCNTIGGTSGSPILEANTRKVIGVNNTGNEDGQKCTMNNPCEVDENGNVKYQKGQNYGQQTYWIYSCLNAQSEFDPTKPGCALPH